MGVSQEVMRCQVSGLELAVDVESNDLGQGDELTYTITMGTGFGSCGVGNCASVNIETPRLTREQYLGVIKKLQEALEINLEDVRIL